MNSTENPPADYEMEDDSEGESRQEKPLTLQSLKDIINRLREHPVSCVHTHILLQLL